MALVLHLSASITLVLHLRALKKLPPQKHKPPSRPAQSSTPPQGLGAMTGSNDGADEIARWHMQMRELLHLSEESREYARAEREERLDLRGLFALHSIQTVDT